MEKNTASEGTKKGDNARLLRHTLEVASWGDVVMADDKAVAERCEKYLLFCADTDTKPTVSELAIALGISRPTMYDYRYGRIGKNPRTQEVLKRAVDIIGTQMEHYIENGKINPVSAIFLMKNNHEYSDKAEVIFNQPPALGNAPDRKILEEKYKNSIVVDIDDAEVVE